MVNGIRGELFRIKLRGNFVVQKMVNFRKSLNWPAVSQLLSLYKAETDKLPIIKESKRKYH